jgi:D-alanyl-lipoteichoic acid acyltransferase DltB (MBOAT superfamily)
MTLFHILILAALTLALRAALKARWRSEWLMALSVVALYWLQPSTPIRHLDFWLPTATIGLVVVVWAVTRQPPPQPSPNASLRFASGEGGSGLLIGGLILFMGLTRYFLEPGLLTPTRPPEFGQLLITILLITLAAILAAHFGPTRPRLLTIGWFVLIALFIILKTEGLTHWASTGLRALTGQDTAQASALDIRWLGFSYIAFRLLHVLRDKQTGRLPALTLAEFVAYVLFFPALTAGPIDRVERMAKDLRAPFALTASDVAEAGQRLALGLFKKFALADTLALIALNPQNAAQLNSTGWAWMVVYAYAFRIYFDFSGYTDIAIGLGRLAGVRLPENFDRPYLKPNLTTFWNSWHITLAQWFRAYFFNPVTRALRSRPLSPAAIILMGQVGTMLLIGLWHGVTWNFVAWGAWHALGLFIHNRWSDWMKPRAAFFENRPMLKRAAHLGGVLLTFHYVALGWVWFALSSVGLAGQVLMKLFGM